MGDPVNSPEHYTAESFECIDVIEHCLSPEEYQGYLKGCIIKYMYRHNYKGHPEQDLEKAFWYLSRVVGKTPTPEKTCSCAECTHLGRSL
jgi:hypothetical protein